MRDRDGASPALRNVKPVDPGQSGPGVLFHALDIAERRRAGVPMEQHFGGFPAAPGPYARLAAASEWSC